MMKSKISSFQEASILFLTNIILLGVFLIMSVFRFFSKKKNDACTSQELLRHAYQLSKEGFSDDNPFVELAKGGNRCSSCSSSYNSSYNSIQDYSQPSFFFQVSPKRKAALDNQVSLCSSMRKYEEPWILGPQQCQSCKSYTGKGGYDAKKWKENEENE